MPVSTSDQTVENQLRELRSYCLARGNAPTRFAWTADKRPKSPLGFRPVSGITVAVAVTGRPGGCPASTTAPR